MLCPQGVDALITYHMPDAHLKLEHCAQGIQYQGPLGMYGHMLPESGVNAGKKRVYSLLGLGTGHLTSDVQQADNWISKVIALDGLLPCLLFLCVGSVALFTGLYHCSYILFHCPLCIFMTCKIDIGVDILHVTGGNLYRLLQVSHRCHHMTDVMGVDAGYVMQDLLRLNDDLMKCFEVAVLQVHDATSHLVEGIAEVA